MEYLIYSTQEAGVNELLDDPLTHDKFNWMEYAYKGFDRIWVYTIKDMSEYVLEIKKTGSHHYDRWLSLHHEPNSTDINDIIKRVYDNGEDPNKIPEFEATSEDFAKEMKKSSLKVGDHVKVIKKSSNYEGGWSTIWDDLMDKTIGKTFKVIDKSEKLGFQLETFVMTLGNNFWYPPFSIVISDEQPYEKIETKEPESNKEEIDPFAGEDMFVENALIYAEKNNLLEVDLQHTFGFNDEPETVEAEYPEDIVLWDQVPEGDQDDYLKNLASEINWLVDQNSYEPQADNFEYYLESLIEDSNNYNFLAQQIASDAVFSPFNHEETAILLEKKMEDIIESADFTVVINSPLPKGYSEVDSQYDDNWGEGTEPIKIPKNLLLQLKSLPEKPEDILELSLPHFIDRIWIDLKTGSIDLGYKGVDILIGVRLKDVLDILKNSPEEEPNEEIDPFAGEDMFTESSLKEVDVQHTFQFPKNDWGGGNEPETVEIEEYPMTKEQLADMTELDWEDYIKVLAKEIDNYIESSIENYDGSYFSDSLLDQASDTHWSFNDFSYDAETKFLMKKLSEETDIVDFVSRLIEKAEVEIYTGGYYGPSGKILASYEIDEDEFDEDFLPKELLIKIKNLPTGFIDSTEGEKTWLEKLNDILSFGRIDYRSSTYSIIAYVNVTGYLSIDWEDVMDIAKSLINETENPTEEEPKEEPENNEEEIDPFAGEDMFVENTELYKINPNDLHIGDKVKVIKTAKWLEQGWPLNWIPDEMDKNVGKVSYVKKVWDSGIGLQDNYQYPWFVLEKVPDDTEITFFIPPSWQTSSSSSKEGESEDIDPFAGEDMFTE
jgi:hypothetical protein